LTEKEIKRYRTDWRKRKVEYVNNLLKPYKGLQREVYIIALSKFINALGALIFPFLALILSKKIGLSGFQAGIYTSIGGFLFIPSSVLGGKLADKYGRKKIILIFESLGMLAYVGCIFIEPTMTMVYMIMLAAVFMGIAAPAHDAMIADFSDVEKREGAYSLLYLGFNLGFAFSMILAGQLFADHLHWMFVIDAATAMIGLLLIAFFVAEPTKENVQSKDGTRATADSLSNDEEDYSGSIFQVLWERPILLKFALLMFIYKFVYSQWTFLMPIHAADEFGEKVGTVLYGNLGTLNALIVVLLTALITRLFTRFTSIHKIVLASLLLSIGFGLLGFISGQKAFYLSVIIFTIGEIMEAISTMPYVMNHTPKSHRARMSSFVNLTMGIGFTVGPVMMGLVKDTWGYDFSWKLVGVIGLVGTFGMYRLSRKEKRSQNTMAFPVEE